VSYPARRLSFGGSANGASSVKGALSHLVDLRSTFLIFLIFQFLIRVGHLTGRLIFVQVVAVKLPRVGVGLPVHQGVWHIGPSHARRAQTVQCPTCKPAFTSTVYAFWNHVNAAECEACKRRSEDVRPVEISPTVLPKNVQGFSILVTEGKPRRALKERRLQEKSTITMAARAWLHPIGP